jgi:hypothetical protein
VPQTEIGRRPVAPPVTVTCSNCLGLVRAECRPVSGPGACTCDQSSASVAPCALQNAMAAASPVASRADPAMW